MKLSSFKYFSHSLAFSNHFTTSSGKHKTRNIFIVEMKDDEGNLFYGEAAPLPEYNSESFEEVENELQRLSKQNGFEIGDKLEELFINVSSLTKLPTVQYALEQIFISCLLKKDKNILSNIVNETDINVNAVMGINDFASSQEQLVKLVKHGYKTVKLKTGKNNFEDLYELIAWAVGELDVKIKFRIDPNRSWDKKDTLLRCERLEIFPIEYIEQPVANNDELINIAAKSSIPIAADESVRSFKDAEKLIRDSRLKFLVIKPMLFGGIVNVIKLIKMVETKDVKIIISSSLESNIGRQHLVLASAIVNNNLAHGLGTADLFTNQPTKDIFPVKDGKINFTIDKYSSELVINE